MIFVKSILLIIGIVSVNTDETDNELTLNECSGVKINDVYYEAETLKDGIDRPYLLTVDFKSNVLYFSYSVDTENDIFSSACIDLQNGEFENIVNVPNGFAQTVDQNTQDCYIGGSDGIYKFDYESKEVEFLGANGTNIWTLHFKDVLYYSVYPSQFLYTLVDGISERFKDLEDTKVDHFVIDKDDDMFFTNTSGLYSQKKGKKEATLYREIESVGIRGLTIDASGNTFVCLQDGIYAVKKSSVSLEKILDIDDAFGAAFDADNNIFYADSEKIVRLTPKYSSDC